MATTTANDEFTFTQCFYEIPLDQWVKEAHKALAKASGWGFCRPLVPGQFGYDNMAMSIGTLFKTMDEMTENGSSDITLDEMANAIHRGWCTNYIFWRDNSPFLNENYYKPGKKLGDKRRNKCADTPYKDLPQDEKDKDLIIARYIFDKLSS